MRHSAVTFPEQLRDLIADGASATPRWDVLFCTDMLGLAEFRGLCPDLVSQLPTIIYFHENQLTYPTQQDEERDFHFAYSNMTSALAADAVWFNSDYHRDEFLTAVRILLRRMPDFGHEESVDKILAKSEIQHPGIESPATESITERIERPDDQPLRIVWASRWEHDKNPELFFAALHELSGLNVPFEISVLGESFRNSPSCFEEAKSKLSSRICHWGFAKSRAEYLQILSESDVVVSTARHEFFGISVLEAVAAGCRPLVPNALAYPETLGATASFFHDGTATGIARSLAALEESLNSPNKAADLSNDHARPSVERFFWQTRGSELDAAVDRLCENA